jgi:hypothetical protein
MREEVTQRFDAIEECYEFMLAYAAQGLPADVGDTPGTQLRIYLQRASDAIADLAEACRTAVETEGLQPQERYARFLTVLERDADASLAAMALVLSQPGISSQMIDNLNASIHLRALLTDIFLLDEIFRSARSAVEGTVSSQAQTADHAEAGQ